MILTIRTDKPESEIGLFDGDKQLAYEKWQAHRQLAETIHTKIRELLENQNTDWKNISGVVVFAGPGSFTGLRIGFATANAIGYSLEISVAAAGGEDWIKAGISKLKNLKKFAPIEPDYGAPVFTTKPKK